MSSYSFEYKEFKNGVVTYCKGGDCKNCPFKVRVLGSGKRLICFHDYEQFKAFDPPPDFLEILVSLSPVIIWGLLVLLSIVNSSKRKGKKKEEPEVINIWS